MRIWVVQLILFKKIYLNCILGMNDVNNDELDVCYRIRCRECGVVRGAQKLYQVGPSLSMDLLDTI